jgi:hypothetical protein
MRTERLHKLNKNILILTWQAVHACNSSPREAKVGESQVQGQPGLHSESPSQKNKNKNKKI